VNQHRLLRGVDVHVGVRRPTVLHSHGKPVHVPTPLWHMLQWLVQRGDGTLRLRSQRRPSGDRAKRPRAGTWLPTEKEPR
jgi:hypothetical protein